MSARRGGKPPTGPDEGVAPRPDLADGTWVVDRFEGGFAVLEHADTKEHRDVPRADLPEGVREGDALAAAGGRLSRDEDGTKARAERIRRLFERLKE